MPDNESSSPSIQGRVLGVPLSKENNGRCFSCGSLSRAVRISSATTYHEIDWPMRFGLEPLMDVSIAEVRAGRTFPYVECVQHIADLQKEIALDVGQGTDDDWDASRQRVLWKDRKCLHIGKPINPVSRFSNTTWKPSCSS